MRSEPEPLPPWWQRKRSLERDVKRVALPGNNLRAFILVLGIMAVFVVAIGVVLAAGDPTYGAAYLTAFGVLAGGLLAITAALVGTWLSSAVKHARLLREQFFEPLSQCRIFDERDGTVSIRALISGPPQPSDVPPIVDLVRVDELALFRFAYAHFEQYPGLKRTWRDAADEVDRLNAAQKSLLRVTEDFLTSRLGSLGLAAAREVPEDAGLSPGEFNLGVGTRALSAVVNLPTARFGPGERHFHVREDSTQSPTTLMLDGRFFVRNGLAAGVAPDGVATVLESCAADAHQSEVFRKRATAASKLREKIAALQQASKLVSAHIGASDWIQGSCDTGL